MTLFLIPMFIEKQCTVHIFEGDKYARCDWKFSKQHVWETVFSYLLQTSIYTKVFKQSLSIWNHQWIMMKTSDIWFIPLLLLLFMFFAYVQISRVVKERKLHRIFKSTRKSGMNCPFSCPWVSVLRSAQLRRYVAGCCPKTGGFLLEVVAILYFCL